MRCEIRSFPAAVLVGALLAAGAPAEQRAGAAKKAPGTDPLVRMDLLKSLPPQPAAPLRSIFSPGLAAAAPEPVPEPDDSADATGQEPGLEAPQETAPAQPVLDLVYLGYVRSGLRIIALVFSEGQSLAVAEGEEIVPGLKVEKIGPDRIEVTGPDGKRTSVPIQGEQP